MSAAVLQEQQDGQLVRLREVIGELLPLSEVEQLIALWEECHSQQGHCSVSAFVEQVAGELGLDASVAAQLRLKLFGVVLSRQPVQRRQPPSAPPVAQPARRSRAKDAATGVFLSLVSALDELFKARFPGRWSALCATLLGKSGWRLAEQGGLLRGEAMPAEVVAPIKGESSRRELVHQYYLALCEVLGPVQADRLLSDAVRVVEGQPAAADYTPRRLL